MTAALVSLSSGRLGQDANVNQMAGSFALHADTKMNFKDAFYFCKEKYGYGLANIQNSEEAKQVLNMVQAANCGTGAPGTRNTWIGLYKVNNDWVWIQDAMGNSVKCDGVCNDLWRTG